MLLLVFAQADHSWIEREPPRFPTIVASQHSGHAIVLPVLFSKSWPLRASSSTLPQKKTLHLAAWCFRQFGKEPDFAGKGVKRQALAHVLL
jgi:hypothetical protein